MSTGVDFSQMTIPHGEYPEFDDHFGQAGKLAARGIAIEYRKPEPAAANDELAEALKSMRAAARHNFGGK